MIKISISVKNLVDVILSKTKSSPTAISYHSQLFISCQFSQKNLTILYRSLNTHYPVFPYQWQ